VPADIALSVATPADPVLCAWEGASAFGASPEYRALAVTKAQYEEQGTAVRRY
jgi:actin-related protein